MKLFKNFINSFFVHFGFHKNLEPITSIMELLDTHPKHILIIELNKISSEILSQTLTYSDLLNQVELLEFDDNPENSLSEYFKEFKPLYLTNKNVKFHEATLTFSEKHKEFKKELVRIKNICLLSRPTFTIFTINIPDNIKTEQNIKYLNDSLITFRDKVRDTLTFFLIKNENKPKLLYVNSPKTPTLQDSPITNSRYDTGLVGWIFFAVLFGLIVFFIWFKIY